MPQKGFACLFSKDLVSKWNIFRGHKLHKSIAKKSCGTKSRYFLNFPSIDPKA